MKSIVKSLLLLSVLVALTSCDSMNILQPDEVMVRIQNTSSLSATNITINKVAFGNLEPGELSEYIDVENLMVSGSTILSTYNASFKKVLIKNKKCELCGMGVEHLPNG